MDDWVDPTPNDVTRRSICAGAAKSLQEIADELKCSRLDAFRIRQRAGVLANR